MTDEKKHWADVVRAVKLIEDQRAGRMLDDEIGILWAADRIAELEAELYEEKAADRAARLTIVDDLNQLQRKYDALVESIDGLLCSWTDAIPACLLVAEQDLLAECCDELRALLENDDD